MFQSQFLPLIDNIGGGPRIEKPWGYEIIWAKTRHYVGKLLVIKEGQSLSLQYHEKKEETIYVLKGKLCISDGENTHPYNTGCSVHIPPGQIHSFQAKDGPCTLIEVSTPQLDDIVRLADRYGRI